MVCICGSGTNPAVKACNVHQFAYGKLPQIWGFWLLVWRGEMLLMLGLGSEMQDGAQLLGRKMMPVPSVVMLLCLVILPAPLQDDGEPCDRKPPDFPICSAPFSLRFHPICSP